MDRLSSPSHQVSLLTTKLYIPPTRPDLASRPRLLKRLDESRHCKLTLLSAQAGFGKTTLLAEWLRSTEPHVAWVSLDESDNDPTRFWAYVVAALQTQQPDLSEAVPRLLQSSHPPPIETLLTGLINEIAAISTPLTLILDDYQAIEDQPIHDALAFLLDHMPAQMHLVIATRVDPPLPIARLRARGQLTELRAADLRFTVEEATGFLNEVMGLDLSAADVNALDARTEGWIVGLQMAALSMRGRKDVSGFIKAFSGSNRFILDYLIEEVLEQQPDYVQEFLLKTSILERMTAPLCDLITDRDDSQSVLESLEAANLFLVPLDEERRWYRYHQLFADLLRRLLQREARDLVPELHRRASEWYEQHGLMAEAVGHALAAGDFERTARLIERTAWPMLTRGEMRTLLNWLNRLPDELVRSRPRIRVFQAWALTLTSELDRAELLLQDIDTQGLEGEGAAVRAYIARFRGDAPRAIELCHRALERLPKENLFLRSVMALSLGNAYWASGDPTSATARLADAATLGRATGDIHLAMIATSILGHAQEMQGGLHQAAETYRQALQMATLKSEGGGRPAPFSGLAYMGLAGLLYEWNDLDGAMGHAMTGIELGEQGGSVRTLHGCYITLARVYQAQGDVEGAQEALHEAESLARRHKLTHVIALVAALQARLWLAQGNLTAAFRWVQASQLMSTDEPAYERESEQLTLSRVLIAQGKPNDALKLLAQLQQAAEAMGRMCRAIEIVALRALALQAQGEDDQALTTLERALLLGEPEGFVRTFVDEGEPMARLLGRALSEGIAPNYVARLLAAFGQEVELMSPAMESLVEPLSERELEVLRLVVAGLSNREIAQALVIAVSTVKSHTNHIYGKLGVDSRTRAVVKARELGLL